MDERRIPERRQIKRALRELGMSTRQVDGLLRGGYRALVGETEAENAELKEQLEALFTKLH